MKSFQSRNPIPIALIGSLALLVAVALAYNTDKLPFVGNAASYHAEFSNAAGIRAGNPVKVAGVVVGHVQEVRLDGTHVLVTFDLKDAWVGDQSSAAIQLNTLLGQRYLAVEPAGDAPLAEDATIPLARTETPYEIVPAINKLSATVGEIDVEKVAASLDAVSDTFADTPEDVRQSLDGLSRLSETITKRNDKLAQLLDRANSVTTTVASRDAEIERLIQDLNPLLQELDRRRDAIHTLLVGTRTLSDELGGLVDDNEKTLKPALTRLASVAEVLERNQANLDAGIKALGPYVHLFTNAVGIGHWFDAYVCGLIPPPLLGANPGGCEAL